MELSARPYPNPCAACVEDSSGWAMLVNLDNAASMALNPTGVMIWKLVNGKRTVQNMIEAVRRHFRDAPEQTAQDVADLLDILAEEGLVGFEIAWAEK